MIDLQESANSDILELKVVEKMTGADLEHLEPVVKKHIKESDHPRLLILMEDFRGWEDAAAFWKDLKMDTEYITDFDRIALLGDADWEKWLTKLFEPVSPTEIKFFEPHQIEHARKWLLED